MHADESRVQRIIYILESLHTKGFFTKDDIQKEFAISDATFKRDVSLIKVLANQIENLPDGEELETLKYDKTQKCYTLNHRLTAIQSVNDQTLLLFAHIKTILQNQNLLPFYFIKELTASLDLICAQKGINQDGTILQDKIVYLFSEQENPPEAILNQIFAAFKANKQIKIDYQPAVGEISSRIIEPLRLVNYASRWYLLAWYSKVEEFRLFLLSGIIKIKISDDPCSAEIESDEIDEFLNSTYGIYKRFDTQPAVIRFYNFAKLKYQNYSWHHEQSIEQGDDFLQVTLPIGDQKYELISKVLSCGVDAEIISPPKLRTEWLTSIKKMASRYH